MGFAHTHNLTLVGFGDCHALLVGNRKAFLQKNTKNAVTRELFNKEIKVEQNAQLLFFTTIFSSSATSAYMNAVKTQRISTALITRSNLKT